MNFTIPSQDYAAHMLKMILGTLWTSIQASGMNISGLSTANNWLGNMFLIFNAAVLTVATFYVMKVIYEGVAHSAVAGEWLGKNMSGFWAPLRVVMFLGLIAPVAGGYSLAQVIVLWTVSQSIGVADSVADAGMGTALAQGMVSSGSPTPSARDAAADMLRGMTCMATVNTAAKAAGVTPPIAVTTSTTNGVTTTLYGGVKGTGVPANACGGFSISVPGGSLVPASAITMIQQGLTSMETTLQPVANAIATQVNAAPGAAGNGTADSYTGGSSTLTPNQVSLAAQEYSQNVQSVVTAIENTITTSSQNPLKWAGEVKQYGFASLGGFMMQITAWDKELSDVANVQPSAIPMDTSALSGYNINEGLSQVNAYIANDNQAPASIGALQSGTNYSVSTSAAEGAIAGGVAGTAAGGVAGAMVGGVPGAMAGGADVGTAGALVGGSGGAIGGEIAAHVLEPVEHSLIFGFTWAFSGSGNPVGDIQSFGLMLLNTGGTMFAVAMGALAAGGGLLGAASDGVQNAGLGVLMATSPFVGPFLLFLIIPLMIAGATLAYVVPMIPYIIYTMAVLGWIMAVMVALIGAPLWAAVHAIPTGEGAIPQEAKQGWKMLLALFVEPALLVFGFFLSIVVFQAAAWLVDHTFVAVAMSAITAGGTGGLGAATASLFGTILMMVILVVVYWKIALWSFSLIMLIPNKALEWAGMQALSDYGQRNVHNEVVGGVASFHSNAGGAKKAGLSSLADPKKGGKGGTGGTTETENDNPK